MSTNQDKLIDKIRTDYSQFKTKHSLSLIISEHNDLCKKINVGTIEGFFSIKDDDFILYSLHNKNIGNGNLDDMLEWLEHICKDNNMDLYMVDAFNRKFKAHLIEKRGYKPSNENDVVKIFKKQKTIMEDLIKINSLLNSLTEADLKLNNIKSVSSIAEVGSKENILPSVIFKMLDGQEIRFLISEDLFNYIKTFSREEK